ncbi:glycosyltransferase family 2 protein [Pseudolysinimonas kribbensis]|uniref:Glycosyl transferase n=1 Tax=Pseudolysinimonas kribbensis TaxID=433641 RepID=A0ABQ6K1D4_9MICO|nr:glycosyltransferase family 2 protein [Pseudolysinimonas kribbensis]GMA94268.1 glycosyl transferase [Pseudolysinimonas kribbensis]
MSPAAVGVVTVTYNTGETLRAFLSSLASATGREVDVVVVDNASADPEPARAIATEHGARFLVLDRNVGYGAGIEAGIEELDPEIPFVLASNPDVTFTPGALDELLDRAAAHPEGGAFGPRVLEGDGALYPSARPLPSLRVGLGHALFVRMWPANPWTRVYRATPDVTRERATGWLSGACLLLRRSAYDAIGGFDAEYFMYFEDVDLGARMQKAHWQNVYLPSAIVTHTGAHSTTNDSRAMERVHHQSAYRYLSRKYASWYLLPLRAALRIGLEARSRWLSRSH